MGDGRWEMGLISWRGAAGVVWIAWAVGMAAAQRMAIEPVKAPVPGIVRPYVAPEVPPPRMGNSDRLRQLVRAGTLYLTRQDAVALALENNIDLEMARYGPVIAGWRVQRAEAGGLLPGVPGNASQAGAVAVGQGVAGSQAAAGVQIAGTRAATNQTANATVSQIGPVTQTLDPTIQEASTFSHTTTPQPNIVQSVTPVLVADTRAHNGSLQFGFLTGGSVTLRFSNNYLNENSPTDVLNPSSAPSLSLAAQHNLLRGFGIGVNARNITVAKTNVNISDLNFKTQVIGVVNQVLNAYYGLAGTYADIKARRSAADVAATFYQNVQRRVSLGALAASDLVDAEGQLVTSRQALVDAEATLQQQEVRLKNLLSRSGTADPVLAGARIVPIDPITIPAVEELPPVEEMVREALANRTDLAAEKEGQAASEISATGTRNGLLPNLQVFAGATQAGLAGVARTVSSGEFTETANPYFAGGIGTALAQVFRRNFPTQRIGAFYQAPVKNQQAQADYAIDQLQLRQSGLRLRKDVNQVQVDVMNYVAALQQARARYEAAVKNRALQEELVRGEEERYSLGASTPYNVVRQQRDLVAAQSAEASALVAYSTARIALDGTLGRTLEANGISISEARTGTVARAPDVKAQP